MSSKSTVSRRVDPLRSKFHGRPEERTEGLLSGVGRLWVGAAEQLGLCQPEAFGRITRSFVDEARRLFEEWVAAEDWDLRAVECCGGPPSACSSEPSESDDEEARRGAGIHLDDAHFDLFGQVADDWAACAYRLGRGSLEGCRSKFVGGFLREFILHVEWAAIRAIRDGTAMRALKEAFACDLDVVVDPAGDWSGGL